MPQRIHRHVGFFGVLLILAVSTGCARIGREPERVPLFRDLAPAILAHDYQNATALIEAERRIAQVEPEDYPAIEAELLALLQKSDGTFGGRQFLCQQLGLVGSERSVPTLEKLLRDPRYSDAARDALERMNHRAASRALLRALDRLEGLPLYGAISSAANRREAGAVDSLRRLARAKDPELAAAALDALGRIGGPRAANFLERVRVAEPLEPVRLHALLLAAESLAVRHPDQAARYYRVLLTKEAPPPVRIGALNGLAAVEPHRAAGIAQNWLGGNDRTLRDAAAQTLQAIPGDAATAALASALQSTSTPTQALAIRALAAREGSNPRSNIEEKLADPDAAVRQAAIHASGVIGNRETVALLVDILEKNGADAWLASEALVALQGDGVNEALIDALNKADASLARRLVTILEQRHATESADALIRLLDSNDTPLRRAAWMALGSLAPPSLIYVLTERLLHAQQPERAAAERAIAEIASRGRAVGDIPFARINTLYDQASVEGKISLMRMMSRFGGREAFEVLRGELESPSNELREAAFREVVNWPYQGAAPELLRLAHEAETPRLRRQALRGYLRIAREAHLRPPMKTIGMLRAVQPLVDEVETERLFLSILQLIRMPEALKMARPYLGSQRVVDEAAAAVISITTEIGKTDPDTAIEALEEAVEATENADLKSQARKEISKWKKSQKESEK